VSHSIAIVDDEPDTVQLFEDILTRNGYNVAGFTCPLLAFEYIKENHGEFDLIMVDYRMTPINGYDFAIKLAELDTRTKLIIITAANGIDENPLKLPVYLKPIKMNKLITIARNNICAE
jgi:DNA-binding NtrC family response regulator